MRKFRKVRQAWVFCKMTKRGRKNYKQRIAYRAKVIRARDKAEVVNEDKNQD